MEERLHKVMAVAGVASRRKCEDMIKEGMVRVNDKIVKSVGFKINPEKDKVYYDGKLLKTDKKAYFILNKPKGVLCTNYDASGRTTVKDLFRRVPFRLYTAGRLDADSEGLMVITNDGELCNKLTHPSYEVPKTYRVTAKGYLKPNTLEKIQKGVWLSEGKTKPIKIKIIKRTRNFTIMQITLKEGKKREIRRIFAKFKHPVTSLIRISIGRLNLGDLPSGQFRRVKKELIAKLALKK